MNVVILGTGRSGTTPLYYLIQEILLKANKGDVGFVYEPFLWDKETFNKKFYDCHYDFQYMSSVSVEGIYSHLKLPLFIKDVEKEHDTSYIQSLLDPLEKGHSTLLKFIRGNGRVSLLKKICPDCRFVFIIRNPIDVVNSAMKMFSFFGEDFHKSDFPRFVNEVNQIFDAGLQVDSVPSSAYRQGLFWYYMNKFCLESFDYLGMNPLMICYEDFKEDNDKYIRRICEFLGVPYEDEYSALLKRRVGPTFGKANLTRNELDQLSDYLPEYVKMLDDFGFEHSFSQESILAKYRGRTLSVRDENECFGKTPIAIDAHYRKELQPRWDQIVEIFFRKITGLCKK